MNNKKTIQKILIGLGVAIVLLIGYSFIAQPQKTTNSQSAGLLSAIGDSGMGQIEKTDAQLVNADILKILGSIENINLKDDIFSNPVFKKLKDTHFSIPRPVKIGRDNPFLPIGFDSVIEDNNTSFGSNPFGDSFSTNPFDEGTAVTSQDSDFFSNDGTDNLNETI